MNILKRPETGSPNYYVRFEHRGKSYLRSLGTSNLAAAKTKAKRIVESIVNGDGQDAERLKLKNDYATIEEVMECYRTKAAKLVELEPRTVTCNSSALRMIFKTVHGEDVNLANIKTSELSAETLEEFKTIKRTGVDGFAALERVKRSANSTITQARSLFTKGVMPIYAGLKLPDLTGWKGVQKFSLQQDVGFRPIPSSVLTEMEAAAKAELREEKPALYLGYLMAMRLGMRDCEIIASRWEWLEEWPTGTQMVIIVRDYFAPKGAEGRVPMAPEVLAEIRALGGKPRQGTDFILPGNTPTARKNAIERELSSWVRKFLPDRVKSVHELRKHAGSIVVTQTQSLAQAQRFLRHRSVATTEKHYATLLDQLAPLTSAHWDDKKKEVAS